LVKATLFGKMTTIFMADMSNTEAPANSRQYEGLKTTVDSIWAWSILKIGQYPKFLEKLGTGDPFIDEHRGRAKLSCETDFDTHVIELEDPNYSAVNKDRRLEYELKITHTTISKDTHVPKQTTYYMHSGKLNTEEDPNSPEVPRFEQELLRKIITSKSSKFIRP
jgi:hypothetical protein